MDKTILDCVMARREREDAGDRDPWTWRDMAEMCWAATASNLSHKIIEGFADADNGRVQRGLHSAIFFWEGHAADPELERYINETDWLLSDPAEEVKE